MWHYVYIITNNINGKRYVGKHSTNNLNDGYMGSSVILEKAKKKYGKENFSKRIVKFFETEDEAYLYEDRYTRRVNAVVSPMFYNAKYGGRGGMNGVKKSEEVRKRMSEAKLGKKNPMFGKKHSEERKSNLSKAWHGDKNPMFGRFGEKHHMFGIPRSEETKRKISETNMGRNHSDETKYKLSEANKGKKLSEETRQKISKSLRSLYQTPRGEKVKYKISESLKTLYQTQNGEEVKKKISESNKTYYQTPEGEAKKAKMKELMSGENNHSYGKKRPQSALDKHSKTSGTPYRVTFTDGTCQMFTSLNRASKFFNVHKATIKKIVESGEPHLPTRKETEHLAGVTIEKLPKKNKQENKGE